MATLKSIYLYLFHYIESFSIRFDSVLSYILSFLLNPSIHESISSIRKCVLMTQVYNLLKTYTNSTINVKETLVSTAMLTKGDH